MLRAEGRRSAKMDELLHMAAASPAWRLCAAAAIGLLIGIERERRKDAGRAADAGLRTFTLVSFLGGLAAQTDATLIVTAVVVFTVSIALIVGVRSKTRAHGQTTQVALVIAVILGILAQTRPGEAMAAAVVVVLVISSRAPLHRFARDWLTEEEVRDGLLFAVAALVVLPILPDRAIDPLGLANPFALWRLAVVLMGVSAFSHFASRILGPRYGLPLSGFAGGFVSSTATIAAMATRARGDGRQMRACVAGAAASIFGSLLFLVILVSAADPGILRPLVKPFAVAALLTAGYTILMARRASRAQGNELKSAKAFDMRTGLIFVGLVSLFSVLSWALIAWLGDEVVYASVIGTALIDAHAAAVSIATLVAGGKLGANAGSFAILIGFSANMLAKVPTAFALGRLPYGSRVTAGIFLLVLGLWLGFLWQTLSP